jgi:hypothetical protein
MNTFGTPTSGEIFSQSMLAYIPTCIREFLADHAPSHKLLYARTTGKLATGVAKSLVDSRVDALLQGKDNRDIMSLLGTFACSFYDAIKYFLGQLKRTPRRTKVSS